MASQGGSLTKVCTLSGHEERVWCAAWRPNVEPAQLASCGSDLIVRIWGQRNGAALDAEDAWIQLGELDASDRHSRTLRSIAWDKNGDVLAVTSFDASTSLWRQSKDKDTNYNDESSLGGLIFDCVGMVTGHENEVKSASFSPSGEYFATCSRDKSVWIYETDRNFEYECVAVLQSHTQDVKMVQWHPTQDILFSCSYDDTIKVWGPDGDDWSCRETFEGHDSTVWGISFDTTGAHFVTCSDDRTLRVWRPGKDSEAVKSKPDGGATSPPMQNVAAAAFLTPLFRRFSGGANAAAVQQPSASSSGALSEPRRPPADAACQWGCIASVAGQHPRPIYSVDWLSQSSSSTACIATACGDNHVRIFQATDGFDLENWACIADVEAHSNDVNCVAWCPNFLANGDAILASASDDAEVIIWRYSKPSSS